MPDFKEENRDHLTSTSADSQQFNHLNSNPKLQSSEPPATDFFSELERLEHNASLYWEMKSYRIAKKTYADLAQLYLKAEYFQKAIWSFELAGLTAASESLSRSLENHLAHAAIESFEPLSSVGPMKVILEGGVIAIHRSSIYWGREIAAAKLDRLLGLRIVPATVKRKVGLIGSLQYFVKDTRRPTLHLLRNSQQKNELGGALQKQRFFDELIGNPDRHERNFGIRPGKKIVSWDHLCCFPSRFSDSETKSVSEWFPPKQDWETFQSLNASTIEKELMPYLPTDNLKALMENRERLLSLGNAFVLVSDPSAS